MGVYKRCSFIRDLLYLNKYRISFQFSDFHNNQKDVSFLDIFSLNLGKLC